MSTSEQTDRLTPIINRSLINGKVFAISPAARAGLLLQQDEPEWRSNTSGLVWIWGYGVPHGQGLSVLYRKAAKDAAEAALIRDLTTDKVKREIYSLLHEHLNRLADQVERAMNASKTA